MSGGKGAARPDWMRIDTSFRRNPKIEALTCERYGWEAIVLFLDSLAYATHHLTEGVIPLTWPRSNGYRKQAVDHLLAMELWHEHRILQFDGTDAPLAGWLINDYDAYQVGRANWTDTGQKRRDASAKAHQARWGTKP